SALDHRLPSALVKVNSHAAPHCAIIIQTAIAIVLVVYAYFIAPFAYSVRAIKFSTEVYTVSQATTTVIWCISMVILFLDLPVLLIRFKRLLAKRSAQLVAPAWVLYLCSAVGGVASLLGIWTTLRFSWNQELISNARWLLTIS